MHDDLLASRPEGAKHDSDICPFCVEAAQDSSTTSRIPPGAAGPDVSENDQSENTEHGGRDTNPMSDTMTTETHEALQAQAVAKAVESADKALETAQATITDLETKVETLTTDAAGLKTDNDRLNGELDTAQVSLKQATEKVTQLEADIAKQTEEAAKAKTASDRAEQVKNLGIYPEEFITERAQSWAELTDTAWAERLDEWQKLKPGTAATQTNSDTASAMSGTSEEITKTPTDAAAETTAPSARRAVLGLVAKGA